MTTSLTQLLRPVQLLITVLLLLTPIAAYGSGLEYIVADGYKVTSRVPVFDVSPVIDEVSACVVDADNGIAWTLGDSGTGAQIGITHVDKNETRAVHITGADNSDWEAMVMDESKRLWILDIGDNGARRKHVTFYQVDPLDLTDNYTLAVKRTITVTYPDEPMDAEAAAYDNSRIYIIEKTPLNDLTSFEARIFWIDVSESADAEQEAQPAGTIPIYHAITDAALTPQGFLYLLTNIGIYVSKNWRAGEQRALPAKFFSYGQQEALAALGQKSFYVGIEKGSFYYVRLWFPLQSFEEEQEAQVLQ